MVPASGSWRFSRHSPRQLPVVSRCLWLGEMPPGNTAPLGQQPKSGWPFALESVHAWCKAVIEATADHFCADKPSLGFYQAMGSAG